MRTLATCRWVTEHQTVILTGSTGTGKSYFGCALAHQACRKGFRAMYRRVPRLFDELRLARADGSYPRVLARIAKTDVIVLDDFAIAPLTDESRRDLLEILEDRYGLRATVMTSQIEPKLWHDYLADPTVADAICGRVLHGAHKLALQGPSRRKTKELTSESCTPPLATVPSTRKERIFKHPDRDTTITSLRSDHDAPFHLITMRRNGRSRWP